MSSCKRDCIEALEAFGSWASIIEIAAYTGRPAHQVRKAIWHLPIQVERRKDGAGRPRSVYRIG